MKYSSNTCEVQGWDQNTEETAYLKIICFNRSLRLVSFEYDDQLMIIKAKKFKLNK